MRPSGQGVIDAHIASLGRDIFVGPCRAVVVPGGLGEMCVLPGHAPLMALLASGEVRLTFADGQMRRFYISGGVLEVSGSSLTLLADEMLRSDEIDAEAVEASRQAAQALWRKQGGGHGPAYVALIRALAQLRVIERERAEGRLK